MGFSPLASAGPEPGAESGLKEIFGLLRARTGHDFSLYKPSTVGRRIGRRLAVHQIETLEAYVQYLRRTPDEMGALYQDLLIGVTGFFRDPEAFRALEETVIPRLFEAGEEGEAIRVWVPGCSTGDEAYSIAILLQERMERLRQNRRVQIFATDIDGQAIAAARAGVYPSNIASDLSPERIVRFFSSEGDGGAFRIGKTIRDMLVFSEQDLIKDPPFSRLDLVSCRNLLIYLGHELQKRIGQTFHYALKPGGFLFLGTSESTSQFSGLFEAAERKARIFIRNEIHRSARQKSLGQLMPYEPSARAAVVPAVKNRCEKGPSLRELTEKAILEKLAPACALVDARGDVLYMSGRMGRFLEPASGESGVNNIFKMSREGLGHDLGIALRGAVSDQQAVLRSGLSVRTNGGFSTVDISVSPIGGGLYLVAFVEALPPVSGGGSQGAGPSEPAVDTSVENLRKELRAKEEYLQAANEALETANEELKSSNEEMQSVNEELQSSNEELETSKEELQSTAEELATVNAELQNRVEALSRANNDINNFFAGTGIGTIFVDRRLRILRYTPTATRLVNLIPSDIGRPIAHVVSNLVGYDRLVPDTASVLESLVPKELDVRSVEGGWYTLRILPYRTVDNVVEGAVISFMDVTERRRIKDALEKTSRMNEDLLREFQHRIKNSFSIILSMIHLSPQMEALEQRVFSISELYEMLYSINSLDAVPLDDYCARIAASLVGTSAIALKTDLDRIVVRSREAAPLGLILTELVTNAVKYAFPDGRPGTITVALKRSPAGARLEVGDDGVGLPPRFDIAKDGRTGIKIIRGFAGQIGSAIRLDDRPATGTHWVVEFDTRLGVS
jgi:two-component system CheB/CheR fusion protein